MGVRICSTILWKQINLPPLFFLNWLVVWISTCSPVLLHGQWVGTLRVILYCIHIDKYIYIQYIRYAYMNSSGEQEWSALPWGRVKVKSQIEISCVVFGCLTFCSIVIPPKIYIYKNRKQVITILKWEFTVPIVWLLWLVGFNRSPVARRTEVCLALQVGSSDNGD